MLYRRLGNTDIQCSVIGLGAWAIGGDSYGEVDDKASIDAIKAAVDAGINLIDTAAVYGCGHSEEVIGLALKQLDRSKVVVATKFGNWRSPDGGYYRDASPAMLRKGLEESLTRLQTDYIDLYQWHWPDPTLPISESIVEIAKMLEEGKIRAVGVSNFSCEQMDEVHKYVPLASLQPPYSLLDRAFEKELLPYCRENNIGVLSYGSIGGGVLSGKYTRDNLPSFEAMDARTRIYGNIFSAQSWSKAIDMVDVLRDIAAARGAQTVHAAINWVLAQQGVTCALVGAKTVAQVEMNAKAADWQMSAEELARVEAAYAKIFE